MTTPKGGGNSPSPASPRPHETGVEGSAGVDQLGLGIRHLQKPKKIRLGQPEVAQGMIVFLIVVKFLIV